MTTPKRTRLTDILTKEVSVVGRAANKRIFVLTKSDDGEQMPGQLVPDGKGGFVTAPAVAPARPGLVEAVEKLTALANAPVPEGGEAEIAKAVSDVVAPLVLAEPRELAPEFATLAAAEPAAVQKMVIGAIAKLSEIAACLALPVTPAAPSDMRWSISDALSGLVDLARLEQAAIALASMPVAKEAPVEVVAPAVEPTVEVVAPPVVSPDMEKYQALAKSLKFIVDSASGITHDTAVAKAAEFDPATASKLLDESTKVIKSLQAKITTLESSVVTPNALPVEGNTKAVSENWPLDMNRPETDHKF